MRRLVVLAAGLAALATACGKDELTSNPTPDGGALGACLDGPTDLPRPPGEALPCELLPPGFVPAAK